MRYPSSKQVFNLKDRLIGEARDIDLPEFDCDWKDLGNDQNRNTVCQFGHKLVEYFWVILDLARTEDRFTDIMSFLGISIPFCVNKYNKVMEFPCEKQSQGRANDGCLERSLKNLCKRWQDRWVVLGNSSLFYYEKCQDPANAIRDNIPFDNETQLQITSIGRWSCECILIISRRSLKLKFKKNINGLICLDYLVKSFRKSIYTKPQRFRSFAPIRENNDCILFSDGIGYYEEVFKAFEAATSEIMICDWWMSPEFPLLRPIKTDIYEERSRLDLTLRRAADDRGVKVYILLYKEFSYSMNNDSAYVKKHMEAFSSKGNIKVLRHPNVMISLWSHHEKMIIVDRKKLFMGGLDLCWGRWDCNNHPLFNDDQNKNWPVVDYYNPLKKDISIGRDFKECLISRDHPRMPWHDVACMIVGEVVFDFVLHFGMYWNHAKETSGDESEVLLFKSATKKKLSITEKLKRLFKSNEYEQLEEAQPTDPLFTDSDIELETQKLSDDPTPNRRLESQMGKLNIAELIKKERQGHQNLVSDGEAHLPKDQLDADYEEGRAFQMLNPSLPLGFNPLMSQKKFVKTKPQPAGPLLGLNRTPNHLPSTQGSVMKKLRNPEPLRVEKKIEEKEIERILHSTNNLEQLETLQTSLMQIILGFSQASNPFESYSSRLPNRLVDTDRESSFD